MDEKPERALRIATAQYRATVGDLERNRHEALRWATAAAEAGAGLAVLPELASSGYAFADEGEAERLAEDAATGPFVAGLTALCRQSGMHVVAGINERDGERRYNSAVLIGPAGTIATYRKLHLFNDEKSWFAPGEGLPIVDLPFGRVGMVVCFDLWFPEAVRALALAGAEVVAVPTNWVSSFKRTVYDERGFCQGDYMAMARAAENGLVVACADRIGEERGVNFLGASIIVGADGWPVAGPAPADAEALLVAEVDLRSVERARRRTPRNHLLGDRRPPAYNAVPVTPPDPVPARRR